MIHFAGVCSFCWSSDSMYIMVIIYHHQDGMLVFQRILDCIIYHSGVFFANVGTIST